jgi:hypothetical protein
MGLRPNRSDISPKTGENKNCIPAKAVVYHMPLSSAVAVPSPVSFIIKSGIIGRMIPIPITSTKMVIKMKSKAVFLAFTRAVKIGYN